MTAEEWTAAFGPFDTEGTPVEVETMATTAAIREGRPAHGSFTIRAANGERVSIEASAFPIVASEHGSSGAMILFWPLVRERGRRLMQGQGLGRAGLGPVAGPAHEPLRRQHLVRPGQLSKAARS